MFCPQCGSRVADGAKFCSKCGRALTAAGGPPTLGVPSVPYLVPPYATQPLYATPPDVTSEKKRSKRLALALVGVAAAVAVLVMVLVLVPSLQRLVPLSVDDLLAKDNEHVAKELEGMHEVRFSSDWGEVVYYTPSEGFADLMNSRGADFDYTDSDDLRQIRDIGEDQIVCYSISSPDDERLTARQVKDGAEIGFVTCDYLDFVEPGSSLTCDDMKRAVDAFQPSYEHIGLWIGPRRGDSGDSGGYLYGGDYCAEVNFKSYEEDGMTLVDTWMNVRPYGTALDSYTYTYDKATSEWDGLLGELQEAESDGDYDGYEMLIE